MSDLIAYREGISAIDEQMAKLFEKRMELCSNIAAFKQKNGLGVRDPEREKNLIDRNKSFIENDDIRPYYMNFLRNTIDLSCSYQEMKMSGMKIAYNGVEGAYAYIAAKKMFPSARLLSMPDFISAYKSVESGECDCAVLPLENSLAGEVGTVMDLMYSGSLFINRLYDLPIRHYLLGIKGSTRDSVKTVISHPQALSQCSAYLSKMGFETEGVVSTSVAAMKVFDSQDPSLAAIASEESAELFDLSIIDSDLQDSDLNTTRFAVFSRSMNQSDNTIKYENGTFILVFTVKNEAGALASTLNIIGAHGYNMRSLKSRPMKNLQWNYYFYMEAEGNIHTQNGEDMLRELSVICDGLKLVGVFNQEGEQQ